MRRKTIRSTPGFFGTMVHHDANARVVGKSMSGLFGTTEHRGKEGTVGRTTQGFFGDEVSTFGDKD